MTREEWCDFAGDDELLFLDPPESYDSCIIGVTDGSEPVVVYDTNKLLDAIKKDFSGTLEEGDDLHTMAVEHYEFNIAGAYVGEKTPIYVKTVAI